MVPRAISDVRKRYPNLLIDVDVLKLEEAIDYLLLGKGELVAISYKLDHPMLTFEPLAQGRLKCIVPEAHPLANRSTVHAREIARHPLIGIDPNDPYGRIMAGIFSEAGLAYDVTIKARFGSTVCALVTNGLGVAVIDEFTLAGGNWPRVRVLDIAEPTQFQCYVTFRKDTTLSSYGEAFVKALREHMSGGCQPSRAAAARVASRARRVSTKK
jgi:DNA-binding transcriptional LysR family regulator